MIRYQVRDHLTGIVAAHPDRGSVSVSPVYPGDKHQTREMVFADTTEGEGSFPYAMTPPLIFRDSFDVVFVVRVAATRDLTSAAKRANAIATWVVGSIAADPTVASFEADGERVSEFGPFRIRTREGETAAGDPLALVEIGVHCETQSTNEEYE